MPLPKRKHPRLKNYDYSQCGCYHITICVKDRRPILGKIILPESPSERASLLLSKQGQVTERYIRNMENVYCGVSLEHYVIMPNHVHILLKLSSDNTTGIPVIVRYLKRMVTRELGESIWQDSYYDVIVRNDSMFREEWEYIDANPDKWAEDVLFVSDI